MSCTCPLPAWKSQHVNSGTGARPMVFRYREGFRDLPTKVPCNQCIGCRLDWAGDWAARCEKEAKLHEENCFVTLTYNEENLPHGLKPTVSKRDWQLFMKRLRFETGKQIRFFASGEYGEANERPHYHAILFGHHFPDRKLWKSTGRFSLYVSPVLDSLWGQGFATVGNVSFQSSSYVARYVLKKLKGDQVNTYEGREPPFILMSRRPGLASAWYDKYSTDVYPDGQLIVGEGKPRRPPRYFDEKFKRQNPEGYFLLKCRRRAHAQLSTESTPQRLYTKQELLKHKSKKLLRPL